MIRQKVIDNYRDMVASLKTELKLAEAEVERLTDLLDHYNAKCAICDCSDDVTVLQAENAKLRTVAEAARAYLKCGHRDTLDDLVQALTELDKEGAHE